MYGTLTTLIDRLDSPLASQASIIRWGCPVPAFGDLSTAWLASVGLNPSNLEFVDEQGRELIGRQRRFHTLHSFGLKSWSAIDWRHLHYILDTCRRYFARNPYLRWFNRMEYLIAETEASYFDSLFSARSTTRVACHLDLIPFATKRKWTDLTPRQRARLLALSEDTLGLLLRDSPVRVVLLNGQSVVSHFESLAGIDLDRERVRAWTLNRRGKPAVAGIAYRGCVSEIAGVELGRSLMVVGFNHNIQSSFGVTNRVLKDMQRWIGEATAEVRQ